jgi:hypothetical protein
VPAASSHPRGWARALASGGIAVTAALLVGVTSFVSLTPVEAIAQPTPWSVVPSPNTGGATKQDFLFGVSCPSLSLCVAVGTYVDSADANKTLIEMWDGTSWSVTPSPNAGPPSYDDQLYKVSCPSVNFCTAVGYSAHHAGSGVSYKTLIESWRGSRWSVVPSPNEAPSDNYEILDGVSCGAANACTAVGYYGQGTKNGSALTSLAEYWDGARWSLMATPSGRPQYTYTSLQGVSCTSAVSCTAVGEAASGAHPTDKTLVEAWNGINWSIIGSPNEGRPGYYNSLLGISCASAGLCTSVGSYGFSTNGSSNVTQTLALSQAATRWSVLPSPNAGLDNGVLEDVSCPLASTCTAVGSYSNGSGHNGTLLESWTGNKWSIVPSPDAGPAVADNQLFGVSCPLVELCVAVGYYHYGAQNTGTYKTLVETS